jgi:hypothetical protein
MTVFVPMMHAEVHLALRDLVGAALILTGVIALMFGVAIMIDVRRDTGNWRPKLARFDWTIAATMLGSFALIKFTLGLLILDGDGPLEWWAAVLGLQTPIWPLLAFRSWIGEGGLHRAMYGANGDEHVS